MPRPDHILNMQKRPELAELSYLRDKSLETWTILDDTCEEMPTQYPQVSCGASRWNNGLNGDGKVEYVM